MRIIQRIFKVPESALQMRLAHNFPSDSLYSAEIVISDQANEFTNSNSVIVAVSLAGSRIRGRTHFDEGDAANSIR